MGNKIYWSVNRVRMVKSYILQGKVTEWEQRNQPPVLNMYLFSFILLILKAIFYSFIY